MAEYDLTSRISPAITIPMLAHADPDTPVAVDLKGFESAEIEVITGTLGAGTATFLVKEADDDGSGSPDTFTTVSDDDLIGVVADLNLAATDDDTIKRVGYIGKKQWLQVTHVEATTWTTYNHCVVIQRGNPKVVPTT